MPSMDARGTPNRSAKKRSVPATAPQLPATEVFETRASCPSAVCSSITRSNGMNRASRSAHALRMSFEAYGSCFGSGSSSERYTDAVPSAVSSIAFTSTPRRSAHSARPSSNRWRGSPYTSPRYPCWFTASA